MQMSDQKKKKGASKEERKRSLVGPPDLRAVASATECTGALAALTPEDLTDAIKDTDPGTPPAPRRRQ